MKRPLVLLAFLILALPLVAGAQDEETPAQVVAPVNEVVTQPSEQVPPEAQFSYPSRLFGMFGDVVYSGTGSGAGRGFDLGQLTLHYTAALAPRALVFAEVTYSPRSDAGAGDPPASGYNLEVERLIFRYDQSDQLKVSLGRYHTPINWWNTAFHHGLWLQTTIARPEMARFGGQFIPVHFVGGLIEGGVPARGLNLNYNVGVGNGRSNVLSRAGDTGDNNSASAWLMNLFVRPDQLYGLQIGASLYRDDITLRDSRREFREQITAAHVVYQRETPEVIAEYAQVDHKEKGGSSVKSDAYYIQLAYRLPGTGSLWKPYYRYEKMDIPRGEPVFATLPSLTGHIVGVRYDFTEFAALKLEYRNMQRTPPPSTTGVFGQVSFAF